MTQENRISVSSDVFGFAASPLKVVDLYERAGWRDFGLEVIGMPLQMGVLYQMSRGHDQGFRLDGVHGRLGVESNPLDHRGGVINWLKIKTADMLMRKADEREVLIRDILFPNMALGVMMRIELIAGNSGHEVYYNVHNPEVESNYSFFRKKVVPVTRFSHLTIENGGSEGDLSKTKDLVARLRDDTGRYVSGTLDFAHVLIELSGGEMPDMGAVKKYWAKVLSLFDADIFHHVHLPIGLNRKDSVPIEEMIKERYGVKELVDQLREQGAHITFENQHSLLKGARSISDEITRLAWIRNGLGQAGL